MALSIGIAFGVRLCLVILFLPFSALDKVLNFRGAVAQAQQAAPSKFIATGLILAGLGVELFMSLAILTGVADRAAALVLAGYCAITALLWKQFWRPGDFWSAPNGQARGLFWDFWKNLSLAGGFLLITFGTTAGAAAPFWTAPLSSTHPYQLSREVGP